MVKTIWFLMASSEARVVRPEKTVLMDMSDITTLNEIHVQPLFRLMLSDVEVVDESETVGAVVGAVVGAAVCDAVGEDVGAVVGEVVGEAVSAGDGGGGD